MAVDGGDALNGKRHCNSQSRR